jgi:cold shock CspA family protein
MQGTVRGFDPASGSGSVFLDDGTVCEFGPEVFAASGLRLLRRGQRVAVRVGPSGAVTALTLATLPLPGEAPAPGEGAAQGEGPGQPGKGAAPGEGPGQPGKGSAPTR